MEGSVLSLLKAEWKVSDTGSAHWGSSSKLTVCTSNSLICIEFELVIAGTTLEVGVGKTSDYFIKQNDKNTMLSLLCLCNVWTW